MNVAVQFFNVTRLCGKKKEIVFMNYIKLTLFKMTLYLVDYLMLIEGNN